MSSKKSKADLLVRVRYQNPLPPPPFPPKLLKFDSDVTRYANYDFLQPLIMERDIPMVADAEQGMHLDLGVLGGTGYWEGDRSRIAPTHLPPKSSLSEEDEALLAPADTSANYYTFTSSTSNVPGASNNNARPNKRKPGTEVSWLRRTEYLSSETKAGVTSSSSNAGLNRKRNVINLGVGGVSNPVPLNKAGLSQSQNFGQLNNQSQIPENLLSQNGGIGGLSLDDSIAGTSGLNIPTMDERIAAIERSFELAEQYDDLSKIKHPSGKDNIHVVESWDFLPCEEAIGNEYNLVKFQDNPGNLAPKDPNDSSTDPKVEKAIIQHHSILSFDDRFYFFLPKDEEELRKAQIERYSKKDANLDVPKNDDEDSQMEADLPEIEYTKVREYEAASYRPFKKPEYIMFFENDEDSEQVDNIEEKLGLREGEADELSAIGMAKKRKRGFYYYPLNGINVLRKRRKVVDGDRDEAEFKQAAKEDDVVLLDAMNVKFTTKLQRHIWETKRAEKIGKLKEEIEES